MREAYDLVSIGGGAAGSEAAFSVADGGRTSILLVESHHFGGTCTNHGCVPTKALVRAARVARTMRTAGDFGFVGVEPQFDWEKVIGRAYRVRDHMRRFGMTPFNKAGADVEFPAQAALVRERRGPVGAPTAEGGGAGAGPGRGALIPPIEGLVESGYLDNESVLDLKSLPTRLVVLGGGPIGLEFAQIFARFGVQVTIVESAARLAPPEEPESGDAIREAFESEGIAVRSASNVVEVSRSATGRTLHFDSGT